MAKRKQHGMTNTPTYKSWAAMKRRTKIDPKSPHYQDYAGRGITLCKRWNDFRCFYNDMGKRPSRGHSLGRIKNHLGYYPANCEWQTKRQQQNARRGVRKFDATESINAYTGKVRTLREITHLALASIRDVPKTGPDARTPEDIIAAFMVWLDKNKRKDGTSATAQPAKKTRPMHVQQPKLVPAKPPTGTTRQRPLSSWDEHDEEDMQELIATHQRAVKEANKQRPAREASSQ